MFTIISNQHCLSLAVFIAYYLIHGVLTERPYEILVLVIATFIVLVYIVVNYAVGKSTRDVIKLVSIEQVFIKSLDPM